MQMQSCAFDSPAILRHEENAQNLTKLICNKAKDCRIISGFYSAYSAGSFRCEAPVIF